MGHLVSLLPSQGVEVEVFTTDLRRDIPFDRFEPPVPNGHPNLRHFAAMRAADVPHALGNVAPGMIPAVLRGEWDILHAHAYGYFPTFAGALGRMMDRGAFVVTPHADPGNPRAAKWAFDRLVPRMTLRRAERVIALTPREATLLEAWGVPADRIAVVPNGVDTAEFSALRRAGATGREVTALFAGRCYPRQKGLEVLLQAMTQVPAARSLRLRIVGEDWGGYAMVAALTREFQLQDRVTLVGRVARQDLLDEFARADIFVLPSLFDSFPIALLEAMAAGLPVIATRVGGVPDVVRGGETALLVDPGDAMGLARTLDTLARDEGLRRELGNRGRERSALFAWESIIPRIKRVYDDAVAERAS